MKREQKRLLKHIEIQTTTKKTLFSIRFSSFLPQKLKRQFTQFQFQFVSKSFYYIKLRIAFIFHFHLVIVRRRLNANQTSTFSSSFVLSNTTTYTLAYVHATMVIEDVAHLPLHLSLFTCVYRLNRFNVKLARTKTVLCSIFKIY